MSSPIVLMYVLSQCENPLITKSTRNIQISRFKSKIIKLDPEEKTQQITFAFLNCKILTKSALMLIQILTSLSFCIHSIQVDEHLTEKKT